jgi:Nucleoside-diphosphate-sugar epimerases
MRIFITGVAGFLGSHLADRMIELGQEVVGVDNLVGGYLDNVNPKVEFYQADCEYLELMKEYSKNCDIVFHAACTAHDGLSVFSPSFITKNTFGITMSVLSAAIQNKIKKFVYCSSMSRYGYQETVPFTEDMVCNPQVPYAVAKYSSELIIKQLAELNQMQYVIVVPHNIIGPRQNYTDPYRNVVSIMINRILQGKQPIIYGDGEQKRCFSFIKDVIYCLEKIILNDEINNEIINIGPDEEYVTVNHLGKTVSKILGKEFDPIYLPGRPLEVKHANCSADKARRLLNYQTKTSLEDGIFEMVNYIKTRGVKPFTYTKIPIEIYNDKLPENWAKPYLF